MNPALEQLRDIRLPAEPGWWPPAPGWWLLLALALFLLAWLAQRLWRYWQSGRYRRQALQELQQLQDDGRNVAELNALLKRTALTAFPDQPVAALSGPQWVAFLCRHARLTAAETSRLEALARLPYQGESNTADRALLQASRSWIRGHV